MNFSKSSTLDLKEAADQMRFKIPQQ
jgi:hypothetical protein